MFNQCGVRIGEDGPDISLPFAFDSGSSFSASLRWPPWGTQAPAAHMVPHLNMPCVGSLLCLYLSSTQPGSTSKELLAFKGLANFGLWLPQSPNLRHFFELLLSDRREMID